MTSTIRIAGTFSPTRENLHFSKDALDYRAPKPFWYGPFPRGCEFGPLWLQDIRSQVPWGFVEKVVVEISLNKTKKFKVMTLNIIGSTLMDPCLVISGRLAFPFIHNPVTLPAPAVKYKEEQVFLVLWIEKEFLVFFALSSFSVIQPCQRRESPALSVTLQSRL